MTHPSQRQDITRQLRRARADQHCLCVSCGSKARKETMTVTRGAQSYTVTQTKCLRTSGQPRCAVVRTEVPNV